MVYVYIKLICTNLSALVCISNMKITVVLICLLAVHKPCSHIFKFHATRNICLKIFNLRKNFPDFFFSIYLYTFISVAFKQCKIIKSDVDGIVIFAWKHSTHVFLSIKIMTTFLAISKEN